MRSYYSRHKAACLDRSKTWRNARPEYRMWQNAKHRAKRSGLEFTISINDIIIPAFCPILGIPIVTELGRGANGDCASLDRIDSKKGYIPSNIQVMSMRANQLKSDATIKELEAVLAHLRYHAHLTQ